MQLRTKLGLVGLALFLVLKAEAKAELIVDSHGYPLAVGDRVIYQDANDFRIGSIREIRNSGESITVGERNRLNGFSQTVARSVYDPHRSLIVGERLRAVNDDSSKVLEKFPDAEVLGFGKTYVIYLDQDRVGKMMIPSFGPNLKNFYKGQTTFNHFEIGSVVQSRTKKEVYGAIEELFSNGIAFVRTALRETTQVDLKNADIR